MAENRRARRELWIILMIVFFGFVGISMPYLIFPALFLNPAYAILPEGSGAVSQALLLGITLAAYPFGQFLGSPVLGALSDDFGRKRLLSATLFATAICNLLTGLAIGWGQLTLLILSRFGAGLMEGNIAIARAMAVDIKALSKHETFGKINAVASIAYLVGPLLGGLLTEVNLSDRPDPAMPFYFVCALFACLGVLSSKVLKAHDASAKALHRSIWERINLFKRISVLFENKQLRFLLIVSSAFTLAVDIFYEFAPVYLTEKWMLSPAQLAFYNGVLCMALAVGNGWLSAVAASRTSNRAAIVMGTSGLALALLSMVLTEATWLMVVLYVLGGLAIGMGVTALTVSISDSAPDAIQGEVMGTQISLRVLCDAIICLLGGALLLISSKLILVLAALISLSASLAKLCQRRLR